MYNYYTPQSDGSYQRSTRPEPQRRPTAPQMNIPAAAQHPQSAAPQPQSCAPQTPSGGMLSFLQELLPKQLEPADLMVVFLVLLLNQEDCRDGVSPMLTLALYFLL